MSVFVDVSLDAMTGVLIVNKGDAGIDLRAKGAGIIPPFSRAMIDTGIRVAIPDGYKGVIYGRSGLAFKHNITAFMGLIDSSYRGEIRLLLYNNGDTPYHYEVGDRVAQLCIEPSPHIQLIYRDELGKSKRGAMGFGSTGVK